MPNLQFQPKGRKRPSPTGGTIREWRSADGRYIIVCVENPWYGRWFRAVRQYVNSQALISERLKTKQAAEQACQHHREQ